MTPSEESYRLIPLTQGQFAKVDVEHFKRLSQWKWYADWNEHTESYYAARQVCSGGKKRTIRMHRFLLGLDVSDARHADHRNGDTLDNRIDNLRFATVRENGCNRSRQSNNRSGYKGVKFQDGRFYARISKDGKERNLGGYATSCEAALAYNKAAIQIHGDFARLNEIHSDSAS